MDLKRFKEAYMKIRYQVNVQDKVFIIYLRTKNGLRDDIAYLICSKEELIEMYDQLKHCQKNFELVDGLLFIASTVQRIAISSTRKINSVKKELHAEYSPTYLEILHKLAGLETMIVYKNKIYNFDDLKISRENMTISVGPVNLISYVDEFIVNDDILFLIPKDKFNQELFNGYEIETKDFVYQYRKFVACSFSCKNILITDIKTFHNLYCHDFLISDINEIMKTENYLLGVQAYRYHLLKEKNLEITKEVKSRKKKGFQTKNLYFEVGFEPYSLKEIIDMVKNDTLDNVDFQPFFPYIVDGFNEAKKVQGALLDKVRTIQALEYKLQTERIKKELQVYKLRAMGLMYEFNFMTAEKSIKLLPYDSDVSITIHKDWRS